MAAICHYDNNPNKDYPLNQVWLILKNTAATTITKTA